ncbi:MAG: DoxX family protein [Alphaproteobacteria bacterium]|nr:DoxX family protein [Alphaproteobacteria bacterium]
MSDLIGRGPGDLWTGRMLSVLRIMVALLFLQHPFAKFFAFPHVAMFDHLPPFSLIWVAGVIELVGGILLLLGLFTRPVGFILSGEMAVAYFMAHAPRGFFPLTNGGEAAVFFCFVFLFFAAAGGGIWSLDEARTSRRDPAPV